MERNAGQSEAKNHARRGEHHDPSSSHNINIFQGNKGEDKICPADDESHCGRLVEPYLLEERSRVVHECIKSTELLERLHAASDNFAR